VGRGVLGAVGMTLAVSACCPGPWPWCPTPPAPPGPSQTIGQAVRNLGYIPLQNPDNNFQRGAVIAVKSADPFSGDIVCSWDQVLAGLTLLPSTGDVEQAWQASTKDSLSVGADVVSKVNAKLEAQAVKSIDASLTNPTVLDLRDTDVFSAADHPVTPNCLRAIRARQQANQVVTIVSSSLGANATYKINWDQSITASAQAQFTPQISGEIAAGLQSTGSGTLTGNGLVYGVKDSTYLLKSYVDNLPKPPQVANTLNAISRSLADQIRVTGGSALRMQ
jgi:hypothetical protein